VYYITLHYTPIESFRYAESAIRIISFTPSHLHTANNQHTHTHTQTERDIYRYNSTHIQYSTAQYITLHYLHYSQSTTTRMTEMTSPQYVEPQQLGNDKLGYNNKAALGVARDSSYDDDESIPSPVGDLRAYRAGMDTDYQALWGPFGIFNQVTSILVNFFVNVGALYGGAGNKDYAGVWHVPSSPNPYGIAMFADWCMTACLVVAGMGLLATPGQWASIWMGQARPIPGKYTTGPNAHWYWKFSISAFKPKGAKMFLVRTLLMVFQFSAPFYGVAMLIFFGMCKSKNIFAGPGLDGANPGRGVDPQCWIDHIIYIWVRAAVFTLLGAYVYPAAYIAALDVENCPEWALRAWMVAMEKKGIVNKSGSGGQLSSLDAPNGYAGTNGYGHDTRENSLA